MGCCSSTQSKNKRHVCPNDGVEYLSVPFSTVLQHVAKPWLNTIKDQVYYYCHSPDCDVVYFGEDNLTIDKSEIRCAISVKEPNNPDALLCNCFDVTNADFKSDPSLKQYVIRQTKNGSCSCESQNPSGRCCLKDFPK